VSGSAATSDLARLALAWLQTGAARNATQSVKSLVRVALLQAVAALCVLASLGCALGAVWTYAAPILGRAGALLAGAGVFGVIALAALGLAWRAGRMRSRSPALGSGGDALLAAAASQFKQHTGLALVAALLAGIFLGGES
jgi:hypothetical protein